MCLNTSVTCHISVVPMQIYVISFVHACSSYPIINKKCMASSVKYKTFILQRCSFSNNTFEKLMFLRLNIPILEQQA